MNFSGICNITSMSFQLCQYPYNTIRSNDIVVMNKLNHKIKMVPMIISFDEFLCILVNRKPTRECVTTMNEGNLVKISLDIQDYSEVFSRKFRKGAKTQIK